jgi:hypothetical protein
MEMRVKRESREIQMQITASVTGEEWMGQLAGKLAVHMVAAASCRLESVALRYLRQ